MMLPKSVAYIPRKALCAALLRRQHGKWPDTPGDPRLETAPIFCVPAPLTFLFLKSATTGRCKPVPRTYTGT